MASPPVPLTRTSSPVSTGRRRDEEGYDEEAEVWAALERLPTYDRVRRTVLERAEGTGRERQVVDLKDIDLDHYLVNKVFKLNNPVEDNDRFLTRQRKRIDEAGVELPTVEIRYEKVKIEGQVYVGSRGLPTLFNTVYNFLETLVVSLGIAGKKKRDLTILEDVSGILKPGRVTLLLGPPGSGKSTYLLALAGMLDSDLKCEGTIQYNGYNLDEFEPRKTASYISQNDLHTPQLTVRETMDYCARFQGVGSRLDDLTELMRREEEKGIRPEPDLDYFMKAIATEEISHNVITQYVMKILGLDICADTIVGDQMIRGISGGQRKRLTTGEMIVGPSRVLFMDEISTGLDSSTTYEVVKCLGQAARIFGSTITISLLQPAPETYELFDDVILLAAGYIIYHGPLEFVEEFFLSCGFKCPKRKDIPVFLQEVTSLKDQEQYWADKSLPYTFMPVLDFAEKFKNHHVAKKMQEELATPFDKAKSNKKALTFDHWSLPQWELLKIVMKQEILLLKKNWPVHVFMISQLVVMGLFTSSLFFRTERHHRNMDDAQDYAGAIFMVLNQVVFYGYGEITFTAIRLPVFYKYRDLQFFPPWTWVLSTFIIKIPFSILESLAALSVTYYLIGFAPAASRFFRMWLIFALSDQMSSGLFRMLAGFCRTYVVASSAGGAALMVLFGVGGYVIARPRIRKWWLWGYWALPISYVQNAVICNEFLAPRWQTPLAGDRLTLGHRFIKGTGQFAYGYFFWMACGVVIAFTFGFYLLFAASLTFIGAPAKSRAQLSEAQLAEQHANRTGEGLKDPARPAAIPRSISASRSKLSGVRARSASSSARGGKSSGRTGVPEVPSIKVGEHESASGSSAVDMQELSEEGAGPSSRSLPGSDEGRKSSAGSSLARGMILPFLPLAITFKDVNYYVDMPAAKKQGGLEVDRLQLLSGITGSFRPGVLTALVGVTGAGKTTLMDVLAGRKNTGYVEGDIRISGYPKVQETFARISGYCEQNDIHSPAVTVHESLVFSAWLRLQHDIENDVKMEFVDEVMDMVELTSLKDSIVGIPGQSGLSTEQRKRLTIAVELVSNPSIIFMDEPTSGLDARAAATVMRAVRNTVNTGRTVVCTIHQPSIDIFDSFDELLLLKRGGQITYHGPLGLHAVHVIEYFQGINGVPPIKEGINPAAWMLTISTPGMEEKLGVDFAEMYKNSRVFEQTKALVDELSTPPQGTEDISFPSRFSRSTWTQFRCLLWKQYWSYWRSPGYNVMRFSLCLFASFFYGTLYYATGKKLETQGRVYSLMASIYASQMFLGVLTATAVQPLINSSRTVFYRERSAGMYSELPYAIAQCMIEVPYVLLTSTLFTTISYTLIKLYWHADKFFWYLYFVFCSQITYVYWGMVTVSLTPTPETAAIVFAFFYNIMCIFTGFILPHPRFPIWWKWIFWVNPAALHIYGTLASQFGDLDDVYSMTQGGIPMSVKHLIKSQYGYKHSFLWYTALMSFLFPFLFALGFVVCIKYLNYQRR